MTRSRKIRAVILVWLIRLRWAGVKTQASIRRTIVSCSIIPQRPEIKAAKSVGRVIGWLKKKRSIAFSIMSLLRVDPAVLDEAPIVAVFVKDAVVLDETPVLAVFVKDVVVLDKAPVLTAIAEDIAIAVIASEGG